MRVKFQFRLSALLIVVFLCTLPFAWYAAERHYYYRQEKAVETVESFNGHVEIEPSDIGWKMRLFGEERVYEVAKVSFAESYNLRSGSTPIDPQSAPVEPHVPNKALATLGSFRRLKKFSVYHLRIPHDGLNFLKSATSLEELTIISSEKYSDREFAFLRRMKRLKKLRLTSAKGGVLKHLSGHRNLMDLNLAGCRITDDDLTDIHELRSIVILDLSGTKITNDGLKHLCGLPNLALLSLRATDVDDKGITALCDLKNLVQLSVGYTYVTPEGGKLLKQKIPHCKIDLLDHQEHFFWKQRVRKRGVD